MSIKPLLVLAALLFSGTLAAQTYPAKPVRLIIPFTAGGLTDVLGRGIASELTLIPAITRNVLAEVASLRIAVQHAVENFSDASAPRR